MIADLFFCAALVYIFYAKFRFFSDIFHNCFLHSAVVVYTCFAKKQKRLALHETGQIKANAFLRHKKL